MTEEILRIRGGTSLRGEISVQGAKNSVLPIMAAALLCSGETVLHHVPELTDVYAAARILNRLGLRCRLDSGQKGSAVIGSSAADAVPFRTEIPDADMRAMRSSIMFLGPMLGRMQECVLTMPGGCELGPRPIDLHLDAMRQMGVRIEEQGGRIHCRAEHLHGAGIPLPFPSVGVTENVIMAAVLADGDTVLTNAAREPEIADLAAFLNQCGAKIAGAGEGTVYISGVNALHGTEYTIMPDRIAAMTWLCAGAAAGGSLCISGTSPSDMEGFLAVLAAAGCRIGVCKDKIFLDSNRKLRSVRYIRTMPHPGFPTDAQALISAVLCTAKGTSLIEETVFESRFKHIGELLRMGADIRVSGRSAVITGVPQLHGAVLEANDLRGGAALAVAAVSAEGESLLRGLHHLDRGYEHFAETFHSLGADVERIGISTAIREKNAI